jgi:Tat protein translocase TatB subunit
MLSFSHLVILFLVALIVFGPEKLPELARTLGRWTMEFRRATLSLREAFERDLREIDREVQARPALTASATPPTPPPASSEGSGTRHP